MGTITVGLGNEVSRRVSLHPPGGESNLFQLTCPQNKTKTHQRMVQPPGGNSADVFSADQSSDTGSENGEEPVRKPYRLASSFTLGEEAPVAKPNQKKISVPVINPVTGEVREVVVEKLREVSPIPAEPVKQNRVPPGGHSTPLW